MIHRDPDFPVPATDALYDAVSLDTEQEPDVLASMGFGPDTGTDVALRHEGMIAYGLQLQEEYDQCC